MNASAVFLVAMGIIFTVPYLIWRLARTEYYAPLVGWPLQTKALSMSIFADVLLDGGVITADALTALLLMAIASTMLSVPVVTPRLALMVATIRRSS
jgi:hypothetical protein